MSVKSEARGRILGDILARRYLLAQFTSRDFASRYRGTHLGLVWSVLMPLVMVAMYTFVFGSIFKSRWGGGAESSVFFAAALFAGLIPFNFFCDVLISSASLINSNSNLVKKVVFPLEILPLSRTLASFGHALVGLVVLVVLAGSQGVVSVSWFYLPLLYAPFLLFCLGVSFFVSALAVFFRDINHLLGAVVSLCLFLSPIFYSMDAVPSSIRPLMTFNPLAIMAEQCRRVTIFDGAPHVLAVVILWGWALIAFAGGLWWFRKFKNSFADVM
jgi:lipopolysaccharide transport system permease protein